MNLEVYILLNLWGCFPNSKLPFYLPWFLLFKSFSWFFMGLQRWGCCGCWDDHHHDRNLQKYILNENLNSAWFNFWMCHPLSLIPISCCTLIILKEKCLQNAPFLLIPGPRQTLRTSKPEKKFEGLIKVISEFKWVKPMVDKSAIVLKGWVPFFQKLKIC